MTIIITGKKIKSVKKGFEFPKNDNDIVIDLRDSTVMPGFIDLHVHIESEYNPEKYLNEFTAEESEIAFSSLKFAKRTLMAGFTTVRDLGGSGVNISLRNAINKGEVVVHEFLQLVRLLEQQVVMLILPMVGKKILPEIQVLVKEL